MILIAPYDPLWPRAFDAEACRIERACDGLDLRIEHVGSTAVPGLAAKPIIDILIGVPPKARRSEYVAAMRTLGYEHKGANGIPGRDYFSRGTPRSHHVHLVSWTSAFWQDHLLFRDHLRAHPEAARDYEALKRALAGTFAEDRSGYSESKGPFVARVVREARAAGRQAPRAPRFPFALRAEREREEARAAARALVVRDATRRDDAAEHPVVLVPSNRSALAPLPAERRRAFRAHLVRVIHDGWRRHAAGAPRQEPDADDAPLPAPLAAVLGGACATCGGRCCTRGRDRAFLSADTFHRWFDERPDATRRDALKAYLAHLGRVETYEGSCVFHGRDGCVMPRAMRSDTCNRFLCGGLAQIRRAADASAPRAFVAAHLGDELDAAAFVDADGVRPVLRRAQPPGALARTS